MRLLLATSLDLRDFEDAMQVAEAVACRADRIVTRNLRDYRSAPVAAKTPQAVLEELG